MFGLKPTTNNQQPTTLLIGLGNPGSDYAGNRHNVGFMAVDAIAADYSFGKSKKAFGGMISEGTIDGHKVFLLKPMGYMNLSGGPAAEAARFYKIAPEQMIVIHDELDLLPGKIRVKKGGGNGGHNGLKSLDSYVGQDYWRVRFGIGHPGDKNMVSDYVLGDFSKAEQKQVDVVIAEISRHIGLLLQGDEAGFMNKIALATQQT
jgi:PTH1 family peptidyl-tRNA hydrolase